MPLEEDYLEVDPPIPGQNYVCLSFVSPENIIRKKTIFETRQFIKSLLDKTTAAEEHERLTPEQVLEKLTMEGYLDYASAHEEENNKIFNDENEFQTNIRGVKIRGVFESLKEAQRKAKILQNRDPAFHIYVGQVGYWLPWEPNPDKVSNEEYAERALNEIVHKYKENQQAKDEIWEKDVKHRIEKTKEEGQLGASRATATIVEDPEPAPAAITEAPTTDQNQKYFEGQDIFLAHKNSS